MTLWYTGKRWDWERAGFIWASGRAGANSIAGRLHTGSRRREDVRVSRVGRFPRPVFRCFSLETGVLPVRFTVSLSAILARSVLQRVLPTLTAPSHLLLP